MSWPRVSCCVRPLLVSLRMSLTFSQLSATRQALQNACGRCQASGIRVEVSYVDRSCQDAFSLLRAPCEGASRSRMHKSGPQLICEVGSSVPETVYSISELSVLSSTRFRMTLPNVEVAKRELFGGAVTATLPKNYLDARSVICWFALDKLNDSAT